MDADLGATGIAADVDVGYAAMRDQVAFEVLEDSLFVLLVGEQVIERELYGRAAGLGGAGLRRTWRSWLCVRVPVMIVPVMIMPVAVIIAIAVVIVVVMIVAVMIVAVMIVAVVIVLGMIVLRVIMLGMRATAFGGPRSGGER